MNQFAQGYSDREPADSLADKSNVIGAWLSTLTFTFGHSAHIDDMDALLPTAKSARSPDERAMLKRVIAERGLCGLANDTKWDEFIAAMRGREGWTPSYRCR